MKEKAEARRLPVEGARNLRDLGGYLAVDGRRVRHGKVLRSGHPGNMGDTGVEQFRGLGLRTIVDLRSTDERGNMPFPAEAIGEARYWARDYDISKGDIVAALRDPAMTPAEMRARLIRGYEELPAEQAPSFAALFGLLLAGDVPLLINCTAGKERTGVASALVLSALGVPRETVIEDYALTEWLEDPSGQMFQVDPEGPYAFLLRVDPEVWRVMNRSDPDYIEATLRALEREHGSAEGFIRQALGIAPDALARLREQLLEA